MEVMYFVVIMDLYGGCDVYIEVSWFILLRYSCLNFGQDYERLEFLLHGSLN